MLTANSTTPSITMRPPTALKGTARPNFPRPNRIMAMVKGNADHFQPVVSRCQTASAGLREGVMGQIRQGQGHPSERMDARMGRCAGKRIGTTHITRRNRSDDERDVENPDEADGHSVSPFISLRLISCVNKILHMM